MSTAPVGDGLRPSHPVGVSLGEKATLPTPAPRLCPNPRPAWWMPSTHHCGLDHELRRAFGITCNDYHQLLELQGGVCAVCGEPPGKWRLVVDHDHDPPYEVRGLAHHRCQRWITSAVVRYLVAPPGRGLGLLVPERKARRLEAQAAAKRLRASQAQTTEPPPDAFAQRLRAKLRGAALEQTTEQGGT